MSRVALSADTIADLDGGIARGIINAALNEAVRDLEDRGEDGQPRRIRIDIDLTNKDGIIVTGLAAQSKLPPRRSKNTFAELGFDTSGRNGRAAAVTLNFQTQNPDRPDQPTLPMERPDVDESHDESP